MMQRIVHMWRRRVLPVGTCVCRVGLRSASALVRKPVPPYVPSPTGSQHVPSDIKYRTSERMLYLSYADGFQCRLPAELLRVESPSAEVFEHSGRKKIVDGKRNVRIMKIEQVGRYALRFVFDDFHDTGIYSWDYLYYLGRHKLSIAKAYLLALRAQNLSRSPLRARRLTSAAAAPDATPPSSSTASAPSSPVDGTARG